MAPRIRSTSRSASSSSSKLGVRTGRMVFTLPTDIKLIIDSWRSENNEFVAERRRIEEEEFDAPMFYDFINGETKEQRQQAERWFEVNGDDPMMIDWNDEVMAEVNAINDGGAEAEVNEVNDGGAEADVNAVDGGADVVNAVNDGEAMVEINANNGDEAAAEVNEVNDWNGGVEADVNAVNDGEAMAEINANNGDEAEAEVNEVNDGDVEGDVNAIDAGGADADVNAVNDGAVVAGINANIGVEAEAEVNVDNDDEADAEVNAINHVGATTEIDADNGGEAEAELDVDNNDVTKIEVNAVNDGESIAEINADNGDAVEAKVDGDNDDEAEAEVDATNDDETEAEMQLESCIEDDIMMLEADSSQSLQVWSPLVAEEVCPWKVVKAACWTNIADLSGTLALNDAPLNLRSAVATAYTLHQNDSNISVPKFLMISNFEGAEKGEKLGESPTFVSQKRSTKPANIQVVSVRPCEKCEQLELEIVGCKQANSAEVEDLKIQVDEKDIEIKGLKHELFKLKTRVDIFKDRCKMNELKIDTLNEELKSLSDELTSEKIKSSLLESKILREEEYINKLRSFQNEYDYGSLRSLLSTALPNSNIIDEVCRVFIDLLPGFFPKDKKETGNAGVEFSDAGDGSFQKSERDQMLEVASLRDECRSLLGKNEELQSIREVSLRHLARRDKELLTSNDECLRLKEKNKELESSNAIYYDEIVELEARYGTLQAEVALAMQENLKHRKLLGCATSDPSLQRSGQRVEIHRGDVLEDEITTTRLQIPKVRRNIPAPSKTSKIGGDVLDDEITTKRAEIPKIRRKIHAPSNPSKIGHNYWLRSRAQSSGELCGYNLRSNSRRDEKSSVTLKRSASSNRSEKNESNRLVVKRRLNPTLQTLQDKAKGKSTRSFTKKSI